MKVNYVVACWSGLRRENPKLYLDDRAIFLKKHLEHLLNVKHNITQVTFVVNHNDNEPKEFREFLNNLPSKIQNADVVLIERPNVGYSYGGYSDVYAKYRKKFSHYILVEDDYVFKVDNFDNIMLNKMNNNVKCGFVSFWHNNGTRKQMYTRLPKLNNKNAMRDAIDNYFPETFEYPRVAVGLFDSNMLEEIYNKFGKLPYAISSNHGECKIEGQFGLSVVGQKLGWNISDLTPEYGVVAFSPKGEIVVYNPNSKLEFVVAIQSLI